MKEINLYTIARPFLTVFMKLFYRVEIVNKEYIQNKESMILCGNHTSNLDSLLVASSTKRNIYFLTKIELFKGIKKYIFKNAGCICVDRSRKNPDAMKEAINLLSNKKLLCIFPEGTINKTSDILMPFKFGAVSLASKTDSYIVPFSITGKYKIFKKSVKIKFSKPYKVSSNLDKENDILMNKVKKLVTEATDEEE